MYKPDKLSIINKANALWNNIEGGYCLGPSFRSVHTQKEINSYNVLSQECSEIGEQFGSILNTIRFGNLDTVTLSYIIKDIKRLIRFYSTGKNFCNVDVWRKELIDKSYSDLVNDVSILCRH